ncbi:MAG: SPOR domain-containing protein [Pseudomonadota bacterium]|nr:SPOR domain-containing protein [Pseudomonadota bacterium]
MTDTRFTGPADDEDRLPWLEAVDEEEPRGGPSAGKLIALAVLLLLAAAAAGGYYMLRDQGATGGDGALIAAPAGAYKIKPQDPGGMEVEGEGDTAFAASEGADPQGRIDMSAVSEEPVVRTKAQAAPRVAGPVASPPEEASDLIATRAGATIQLGAFSTEAAASAAWKTLSGRFAYLSPLSYSVVAVESGERTLYRLRASGPEAANLCGRLRIAGENCVRVN